MEYIISYELDPEISDTAKLIEKIGEHNKEKAGIEKSQKFAFFIKDKSGQILGGCLGYIWLASIHIDHLWVHELLRNKDYGTQLMQKVETLGKEKDCSFVTVSTLSCQALDFYKKLGYKVEFERGYQKNQISYYLRKDL